KICDQISDRVLDECLKLDENAKVACETTFSGNQVTILGELSVDLDKINFHNLVEEVLKDCDYYDSCSDGCKVSVDVKVSKQSTELSDMINRNGTEEIGAGDQGFMIGYASNESPNMLPLPCYLARKIIDAHQDFKYNKKWDWLKNDCKTQVSMIQTKCQNGLNQGKNYRILSIIFSTQHKKEINDLEWLREELKKVIFEAVPYQYITDETQLFIQPGGLWTIGGATADTGLTGRKIIVDTYGSSIAHGGGAFSGKDCTKVDRTGAYAARWIAKSIVLSGLAQRAAVQLGYAVGRAFPIAFCVETFGTGAKTNEEIERIVQEKIDLRPFYFVK
ncbi:MAG: methionine adenosyltransferase sam2, partial [Paramarteilia canceri]